MTVAVKLANQRRRGVLAERIQAVIDWRFAPEADEDEYDALASPVPAPVVCTDGSVLVTVLTLVFGVMVALLTVCYDHPTESAAWLAD